MEAQQVNTLVKLPKRATDSHKGTFGSVAIVGGSAGMHHNDKFAATMLGAPALAAMGAIRAGCGLVKVAVPMPLVESVLTLAPFATGFGLEVDADRAIIPSSAAVVIDELVRTNEVVVVGPGMGTGHEIEQIVTRLIGQEDVPIVVDADGLNALTAMPDFTRDVRATMVMTPHPGEAKRLMAALSITGDPAGTQPERIKACVEIAQRVGCVVVLKGKGTVVSNGHLVWVCDRGCSALSVGGTGDVLAGVIGSLIAQKNIDLFMACAIGVQAHAIAGEQWATHHNATSGMIANELADELAGVIETMRQD
ncbi:NAD(P)H-hydrate dehydratase [bacterium]|nr:MAG: NAD(P)H-hydrate dehydratase [bacterium]